MVNNGNNGDEGGGEGTDAQTTYTERMIDGASTRVGYYAIATGVYFHAKVAAIQKEAQQNGVLVNPKAVRSLWEKYLRMVRSVFSKYFGLVYRAVKAEHGDHAAYAMLDYERNQRHYYLANEAITRGHIIPCVARLTGKTSESLLQEFWEVVNLDALTSICRPSSRVAGPKPTAAETSTFDSGASVPFRLEEIANPPEGTLASEVVLKLHPYLRDTIRKARLWLGQQKRNNKAILPKHIHRQFPLLKQLDVAELTKYVIDSHGTTPHVASLSIMHNHSELGQSSIERYTRPIRDNKSKTKNAISAGGSRHLVKTNNK